MISTRMILNRTRMISNWTSADENILIWIEFQSVLRHIYIYIYSWILSNKYWRPLFWFLQINKQWKNLYVRRCPGRTIRSVYGCILWKYSIVYGAVLLCPKLRENTVRLRRRMKQIYGENTDSRIDWPGCPRIGNYSSELMIVKKLVNVYNVSLKKCRNNIVHVDILLRLQSSSYFILIILKILVINEQNID
jgi:hypothetical protein